MWRWRRHPVKGEEISTYLDGRLPEAAARRVGVHLEACEACQRRLEELRATVRVLRGLPAAEVPRSFALRREAVFAAEPRVAPPALRAYRYAGALATVALVVFGALIATDLSTLGGGPEPVRPERALLSAPAEAPLEAEAPAGSSPAVQATPGAAEAF